MAKWCQTKPWGNPSARRQIVLVRIKNIDRKGERVRDVIGCRYNHIGQRGLGAESQQKKKSKERRGKSPKLDGRKGSDKSCKPPNCQK